MPVRVLSGFAALQPGARQPASVLGPSPQTSDQPNQEEYQMKLKPIGTLVALAAMAFAAVTSPAATTHRTKAPERRSPVATRLTMTVSPDLACAGSYVKLSVQLTRASDGTPIANAMVSLYGGGHSIGVATTGTDGTGSRRWLVEEAGIEHFPYPNQGKGRVRLNALFWGDARIGPAEARGYLYTVVGRTARIVYTGPKYTNTSAAALSGTVTDNGCPVPGGQVEFVVGTRSLGVAATDSSGTAAMTIVWPWRAGAYPITARFLGGGDLIAANDTRTVYVVKP